MSSGSAIAVVALVVSVSLAGCLASGPAQPEPEAGYRLVEVTSGFDSIAQFTFDPQERIWYTERTQGLVRILENGTVQAEPFATVQAASAGEQGLLGIALHPDYPQEPWVYAYYTYAADGQHWNRLVRFRDAGGQSGGMEVLLDRIPGARYHDGGTLAFDEEGLLWVTTGEAHERGLAQQLDTPAGKILRLTPEGEPAPGNPFGANNPAYTLGHRNSFGIAMGPNGTVWITENGPSQDDEVNRLVAGANYGWPQVTGRAGDPRFRDPVWVWEDIIAPTGIQVAGDAYPFSGNLVVGDWITGSLRLLRLSDEGTVTRETLLARAPEGITDVETGPDGRLYLSTPHAIYRLVPE